MKALDTILEAEMDSENSVSIMIDDFYMLDLFFEGKSIFDDDDVEEEDIDYE